jgi:hypothetical protein
MRMFIPGLDKYLRVRKGTNPRGAPLRWALALLANIRLGLEMLCGEKQSSLIGSFVDY